MKQRYFIVTGQVAVMQEFLSDTTTYVPFNLTITTDGAYPSQQKSMEDIATQVNQQKVFVENNITIETEHVFILNVIELSEKDYESWMA